jgi:exonuclease SbcD
VTLVELGEKGTVEIRALPLTAKRDMVRMAGTFEELTTQGNYTEDYYEITLMDEEDVPNALSRLRAFYPNVMALRYDNTRTRTENEILGGEEIERKSPIELFDELYEKQNGKPMSEEQRRYLTALAEEIWREEE